MAKLIPIKMAQFVDLVAKSRHVGVIGFPGTGKTTLVDRIACTDKVVIHTDDFLKTFDHDARPEAISAALVFAGPHIVEGNEVTRLITRGMKFDLLVLVNGPTTKTGKTMNGLRGRLTKFVASYKGDIYVVNPQREGL